MTATAESSSRPNVRLTFAAFLIILTAAPWTPCASQEQIRPFTTDGCSDFPDGTRQQKTLWLACCIAHDQAYWRGGTFAERIMADLELERCVSGVGQSKIAALMLAGVRVGGSPFWPTPFRWGYGWAWPRGYRALTQEESLEVDTVLRDFREQEATSTGVFAEQPIED